RSTVDDRNALRRNTTPQPERRGVVVGGTPCEQQPDRRAPKTPRGEGDNSLRGGIQPLDVVDADQDRPVGRKLSQDARERHPDDAEILPTTCCLFAEEREAHGAP